jgi:hypothetical protein
MQSKIVQCLTPQDLKAQVDLIIAADAPTWMQITEMHSARTHFIILWV